MSDHNGRSTAVEHVRPGSAAPAKFLGFDEMMRQAEFLSKTNLVPTALQNKPDDIVVVGLTGQALGVPFITAVSEIYVIEGKASPSAQLRLGLVRRAGHEAMFVESSAERAVIRGRRREHRNDPNGWVVVDWTIAQARQAGMLDEFVQKFEKDGQKWKLVESITLARDAAGKYVARDTGDPLPEWGRKQVASGRVKRRDNWHKYPTDMLRARAASTLCRMHFSDVLTGLGLVEFTPEELDIDTDFDVDDRLDAPAFDGPGPEPERVEARLVPTSAPTLAADASPAATQDAPPAPAADLADEWDKKELAVRFTELTDEFRAQAWAQWKSRQLPPPDHPDLTKDQSEAGARILCHWEEEAAKTYDARRRKAFALFADVGVRAEADRHAMMLLATGGETQSTGKLEQHQIDALEAHIRALKDARAVEAQGDTGPEPAPARSSRRPGRGAQPAAAPPPPPADDDPFAGLPEEPYQYADDDPGRPF
ncbi:MAG: hypothetical protein LC798_16945 [Chloroflexi bacterium]|nr:hypothetical protein [Chloroflexota bacterium]